MSEKIDVEYDDKGDLKCCPFCKNESEYQGESVVLHCGRDIEEYYSCEKCGKKWRIKDVIIKSEAVEL